MLCVCATIVLVLSCLAAGLYFPTNGSEGETERETREGSRTFSCMCLQRRCICQALPGEVYDKAGGPICPCTLSITLPPTPTTTNATRGDGAWCISFGWRNLATNCCYPPPTLRLSQGVGAEWHEPPRSQFRAPPCALPFCCCVDAVCARPRWLATYPAPMQEF